MHYIDANIFIYAAIDASDKGDWSRSVIQSIEDSIIEAATSCLTWDEFTYALQKKVSREIAEEYAPYLFKLDNLSFVPVNEEIIKEACFFYANNRLRPRDAIHAASASYFGAETFISEDSDFDRVSSIRRIWMEDIREK